MYQAAAAAALLVVSGCVLAGCGNAPQPRFSRASDTPAVSASVTPTANSETPRPETAEHFLRRWWAISDNAERTGDVGLFTKISGVNCDSCSGFAASIEKVYASGGVIKFPGTRIVAIRKVQTNVYRVTEKSPPTHYRDSSSGSWRFLAGGTTTHEFTLGRRDRHWIVEDYTEVSGSVS